MKKIIKKKFYSVMLSATLLASLIGCGKENENTDTEANVLENTKLALTDDEVIEYIKNNEDVLNQVINEFDGYDLSSDAEAKSTPERKELARKSYIEYKKFYDAIGKNQEDVNIMAEIINGNFEGYTSEEIDDALELIQMISFPDNFSQILNDCNAIKLGNELGDSDYFNPETDEYYVLPYPKLSEFIENQEAPGITIVENYEKLVEECIDELKKTGTYSDAMAKKVTEALVNQEEEEYASYTGQMDSSLNNEGITYVITATKLNLSNFTQMVNYNTSFAEGKNGKKYQLSARSDVNEEGYVESDKLLERDEYDNNEQEMPSDLASIVAYIESKLVPTKYKDGLCNLTNQIKKKAGNTDTSMIDLQKQKKMLLEKKKLYIGLLDDTLTEIKVYELTDTVYHM